MNFAFIVHLRKFPDDLAVVLPIPRWILPILRPLKPLVLFILWSLKGRKGFWVKSKFKIGERKGYILLIWLTGEQVMANRARQRILDAVLYAQNSLGCSIVGLGALTSSVTRAGKWVVEQPEVTAAITHGDSYAVAVSIQSIQAICRKTNLNLSETTMAIVGAYGLIGKALASYFMPMVRELVLVGTKDPIENVSGSDIVIMATNSVNITLRGDYLKPGAIIYDLCQPRNTDPSLIRERPDVLVVDGSLVVVPPDIKFWQMSLPEKTTFACMAETIMQVLANDRENHVGDIDPDFLQETVLRAEKYGFCPAPFTSFGKTLIIQGEQPVKTGLKEPVKVRG